MCAGAEKAENNVQYSMFNAQYSMKYNCVFVLEH